MKNIFAKYRKVFVLIVCGLVLVVFNFINTDERSDMKKTTVTLNGHQFVTWIADSPNFQERGLSGVKYLGEDQAMIFVFSNPGVYGFWMKDMSIPIDMAWFDSKHKLIYMQINVSPSTYPKVFSPNTSALYVLETKAGELDSIGVKIGDVLESPLFKK